MLGLGFQRLGGGVNTARYISYKIYAYMGAFRRYRLVDWKRVRRLVFVCSGNICRSPYAAERARAIGLAADSCGTAAVDFAAADARAIGVAAQRGVFLQRHTSSKSLSLLFDEGDLALVFEPQHLHQMNAALRGSGAQITLLGLWSNPTAPYVPDPFGRDESCFKLVFDIIDGALANVQAQLHREAVVGKRP